MSVEGGTVGGSGKVSINGFYIIHDHIADFMCSEKHPSVRVSSMM